MTFLESKKLQAADHGSFAQRNGWPLSDRNTQIAIASVPGTLFAVTNYAQTIALANVSLSQAIIALPAFVVIFNLFAPIVLLGQRLLRSHSPRIAVPLTALAGLVLAALHLTIISGLVTWVRASHDMAQSLPVYWSEILITCLPVWMATYVCTLVVLNTIAPRIDPHSGWKLEVRHKGSIVFLGPDEIHYALSEGNYVRLFTQYDDYLVRMPLSALARRLPSDRFTHSHRGAIVRNSLIRGIKGSSGVFRAELQNGAEIPVSRSKLATLKASIG